MPFPTSSRVAGLLLLGPSLGCAAAPRADGESTDAPRLERSAEAATPTALSSAPPSATGTSATTATRATPARPARPALDSHPEGLRPLEDAEKSELRQSCKAFTDAVAKEGRKAVDKAKPGTRVTDVMLETIERLRTSSAAGPGGRCADLMQRDTQAYAAHKAETEAIVLLKVALKTLADAWTETKSLCPSAGPVPREVETLRSPRTRKELGPPVDDLRCASPNFAEPSTRWSLEIRTDAAARSFELIARGFPVPNGPVAELFVRGEVGADGVPLDLPVMRR